MASDREITAAMKAWTRLPDRAGATEKITAVLLAAEQVREAERYPRLVLDESQREQWRRRATFPNDNATTGGDDE